MADYTPVHNPAHEVSLTAGAAITGGQVVIVSGVNTVSPAAADASKAIGVAAHDAATGSRVTVFINKFVHETTSSGTVTAADDLATGAAGVVVTKGAAVNRIGIALTGATGGAAVRWIQL